jgi:superfamily II DNA or RNA helicase
LPKSSAAAAALRREIPECFWDKRSASFRTPAKSYARLLRTLNGLCLDYEDRAGNEIELHIDADFVTPNRSYQQEALEAWLDQQSCGVVVLPTGSGKTRVALLGA